MKIAYCVLGTFNSGGMERVLANKANYLVQRGYEVTIITTDQKGRKPYFALDSRIQQIDLGLNYTDDLKFNVYTKIFRYLEKQKAHKRKLKEFLMDLKCDIVISLFDHDATILPKIKDGSKKILEIHFFRFKRLQYQRKGLLGFSDKIRSQRDLKLARKYDKFVVLTEEDKSYWVNVPNILVIANANSFVPERQASLTNKQVMAVGRYDAQKNFSDLIKAWKIVAKQAPDWTLKIYGHGPQQQLLIKQITELELKDSIVLHPPVSDIETAYLNSSILAMTSRYEGLPMALLEAQACGLPMVSYACKCGPSDIIQDGINGFLLTENDIDGMAKKLLLLIQDIELRVTLGSNAFRLSQNFSEDKVMSKWINLFNDVLKSKTDNQVLLAN